MTTPAQALAALQSLGNAQKATEMAAYHKLDRPYLGVSNPQIDLLVRAWKKSSDTSGRVAIARYLWDSNIHEARVGAAKLLVQKRILDDAEVWLELCRWVPQFDAWAVADHACQAGAMRLRADPERLNDVQNWTVHENLWVRRAALVICLPWARLKTPNADELEARERILNWAVNYVPDHQWFIQKSIGWWLRELSKRDPARVREFLSDHGPAMKAFARKEASKYL